MLGIVLGRRNFGNPRSGVGVWSFKFPPIDSQKFAADMIIPGQFPSVGQPTNPLTSEPREKVKAVGR